MAIIRAQHTFQGISLQPEDRYVNVFYFQSATPNAGLPALADAIKAFYQEIPPQGISAVGKFLAGTSDGPGATIKMYNLEDAKPRAPIYETTYDPANHAPNATKNLPSEVAVCLSYGAAAASGVPIGRRRGRLYIGPLCDSASSGTSQYVESVPSTLFMDALVQAASGLHDQAQAAGFDWSVYSPTNQAAISITYAKVDNAWDTQRRRGNKPTAAVQVVIGD